MPRQGLVEKVLRDRVEEIVAPFWNVAAFRRRFAVCLPSDYPRFGRLCKDALSLAIEKHALGYGALPSESSSAAPPTMEPPIT